MPALVPHDTRPADGGTAAEFVVDPAKFRDAFAGDLPPQRPRSWRPRSDRSPTRRSPTVTAARLEGPAVVGGRRDRRRAAGADLSAPWPNARAQITEVVGSHVVMVSQPEAVTDVIMQAVAMVRQAGRRLRATVG